MMASLTRALACRVEQRQVIQIPVVPARKRRRLQRLAVAQAIEARQQTHQHGIVVPLDGGDLPATMKDGPAIGAERAAHGQILEDLQALREHFLVATCEGGVGGAPALHGARRDAAPRRGVRHRAR